MTKCSTPVPRKSAATAQAPYPRRDRATPGEFRRSQNWIGPAGSTPLTAPYVPPPPEEMQTALGLWEGFLHEREAMPDLVQCALMHEQFEAIHAQKQMAPYPIALLTTVLFETHKISHLIRESRGTATWDDVVRAFGKMI